MPLPPSDLKATTSLPAISVVWSTLAMTQSFVKILTAFTSRGGEVLNDIYSAKGGFRKTPFCGNFDVDGRKSVFSQVVARNPARTASVCDGEVESWEGCVGGDCVRVRCEVSGTGGGVEKDGEPLDLPEPTKCLTVDAVAGYLLVVRAVS